MKEVLNQLYEKAKSLDPGDIMRCITQAETDEERRFNVLVLEDEFME